MITEFKILGFMADSKLIKLSFEHNYMMTLGLCSKSDAIRNISLDEMGFKIRYCHSSLLKTYEDVLIMEDDELFNFILPYFVEQKLLK